MSANDLIVPQPKAYRLALRALLDARLVPLVPALMFLIAFFLVPVFLIVRLSLQDASGAFSLMNFQRFLDTPVYLTLLGNTFETAIHTTLLALLVGYPIAYFISTTSKRVAVLLIFIVMIPMWTSYLSRAIGWLTMLGRRGAINRTLMEAGIIDRPLELIYNQPAVLTVMTHGFLPLVVLTMAAVMRNIDRNLSSAASTLGASASQTFWRVYFPLSLPGIAAAALLVFVGSLGMFVTPILIGSQDNATIAQAIVEQIDKSFDLHFAATLVLILLAMTLACLGVFNATVGAQAITGGPTGEKSSRSKRAARLSSFSRPFLGLLGKTTETVGGVLDAILRTLKLPSLERMGRWPLRFVVGLCLLFVLIPTLILVPLSVSENRFLAWPPSGFTLAWYEIFFTAAKWQQATLTSVYLGAIVATLALVLGVPAAFTLSYVRVPLGSIVLAFIILPILLPHIALAVGLYYVFAHLRLLGTDAAIIIGHTIFALPYVVVTVMAMLRNYDRRIDQAAWTLGATKFVTFRRITGPLLAAGLFAALLFAFIQSFDELTMILFMGSASLTTLPKELWSATRSALDPTLAAISTLILLFVAISLGITRFTQSRSRESGPQSTTTQPGEKK